MSELAFSYRRGGLHFPALRLWLDAPTAIGPSEVVCVSHAHSDHTGAHKSVVFSGPTQKLMRVRVAGKRQETALEYGVARRLAGLGPHPEDCQTQLTLLPAGHILGSVMVFLQGEEGSLLYTGDFKLRRGLSAEACRPREADVLIMETTFGRPQYVFPPSETVWSGVIRFCREALDNDETPVLLGYSLGKAQEILCGLSPSGLPISVARSVGPLSRVYEECGVILPPSEPWDGGPLSGRVLVAPPGQNVAALRQKLGPCRLAVLTGWALQAGCHRRYGADAAFPISDHADFPELLEFVRKVRPRKVYTLHGYAADFAAHLRDLGYDAEPLSQEDQLHLGLSLPHVVATECVPCGPRSVPQSERESEEVSLSFGGSFHVFAGVCAHLFSLPVKAEKISCLAEYLPTLETDDLRSVVTWWMGGRAVGHPAGRGRWTAGWLRRVLSRAADVPGEEIRRGELCHGTLAEAMVDIWHQRESLTESGAPALPKPVDIQEVDQLLRGFGDLAGATARAGEWEAMFRRCRTMEVRVLVHILLGTLRIGLKPSRLAEVVAQACPGVGDDLIQWGMGGAVEEGKARAEGGNPPTADMQLFLLGT